ncbi:MAG TPA: tetratricopeptide repeat protein [Terriglobales bacterium]|jgi:tetratricopeptide (TPR) repeat protein/predicted Ser/Thr protein kinase|nr:tetratricopeptide repeat protein [Terriglobales bacterium]
MDGPKTPRDDAPDANSRGLRAPVKGESSSSGTPLNPDPRSPLPFDPNATMVDLDATLIDVVRTPPPAPRSLSNLFVSAAILQLGDVLGGRYEVLQLLGEGGMGAVYKAKDRELDRFVALKVIRRDLASNAAIVARFKQELLLSHQVTHKNVIRIYDLADADGVKFITMEFIEGADLRRLLMERGKYTPEEAVETIRETCFALYAAHSVGVIHRDLKPQNIMRDMQGRTLVMDFGLARSVDSDGMTNTGALVGTMEYMSPEQAVGKELDQRSDIFALGLVFFELLTGNTPYKADTAIASLLKRNQERAIPAVDMDPSIPKGLSDIVAKCLEREVDQRYQTVQEILNDLDAFQGKRPVSASLISAPFPTSKKALPVWQWATAVLAIVIAVAGWMLRGRLIPAAGKSAHGPVASLAILPFRNASGDASLDWLGSSLAEMLSTDVGQSASLRMVSSDRLHQVLRDLHLNPSSQLDPQMLKQLGEFSNAQTLVWGQYVKVGDQIRIDATLQDLKRQRTSSLKVEAQSEKDLLAAVDRLSQSIRENLALSPEIVKELQAQAFRPSSKSTEALRDYNQGIELVRQGNNLEAQKKFDSATQEDSDFALAFSRLAQTYSNLGYDNEAERYSRRAVELSASLPTSERYLIEASNARIQNDTQKAIAAYQNIVKVAPEDPDIQFTLASLYEDANDFDNARLHLATVLEQDPKYVDALLASGRVEIKSGNPQNGLDFLNRALTLAIQLDNQEEKAAILQAIGVAYRLTDKPQEALRNYQESMAIKKQIGDKRGIAVSLNESAQAQVMLGQRDAALASYKEALQIRREIGDKRGVADTLNDLANFYQDAAQPDEALKLYKEALQSNRDLADESGQAMILNNIGTSYLSKGQYQDALTYYQQALQLREKLKVPDDIAETIRNLAATDTKLGQYDEALSQYLKALDLRRSTGDKRGAAVTSYDMGSVFAYQGRYGAALNARQEALKTFRDLQDRSYWMGEILSGYGESLVQAGRGDEAKASLDEGLALARELKNESLASQLLRFQGDNAAYGGDYKAARELYEQSLQSATRAKDAENTLLSKLALARNDLQQGRSAAAISTLKDLSQQAESQGLKYEAVQCSLDLGEALINTKAVPQARVELERALTRSEKLGLRSLQARAEYLLATVSRLSGSNSLALDHYHQSLRLLDDIRKEAGNDKIMNRADFAAISNDIKRWAPSSKT